MKKKYICIFFIFIYNFLLVQANIDNTLDNSLVISKNIDFQIEIQDSFGVDGATLDFGDLVRGSRNIVKKESNLKILNSFNQDMNVYIEFIEELSPEDPYYAKYKIEKEQKDENQVNEWDIIEVYLVKKEKFILEAGKTEIPIIGEIREVGEKVQLGKYSKNIQVKIIVVPTVSEGV